MKVAFLGTSGFGETPTRNTVAILLDDRILIDAGEGVTRRLLKRGGAEQIMHIVLTHGHMDHFIGLFPLLWQYLIVDRRQYPLDILCPTYVEEAIQQIIALTHFPPNMNDLPLRFHTIEVDSGELSTVNLSDYEITPILMQHSPPCVAYRFTVTHGVDTGKSFAFTGDSRPTEAMTRLAQNADLFVAECTFPEHLAEVAHRLNHLTPVDVAQVAKEAGCARLGLIHHPDYILEHKADVEV